MNRILAKTLNEHTPLAMMKRFHRALEPLVSPAARHAQAYLAEQYYPAVVTRVKPLVGQAVLIEFKLLDGYRLNYRSGQSIQVSVPVGAVVFQRPYSFCSAPHENRYAIAVQKRHKGRLSSYLRHNLHIGDKLYIDEPEGEFVLPVLNTESERYVMIAGGMGVIPVFSMIKDLLGKYREADVQLILVSQKHDPALFTKEIEKLERKHPRFSVVYHCTDKKEGGYDADRQLDGENLLSRLSDPGRARFFVGGPSVLVKKCISGFLKAGLPESSIKVETFQYSVRELHPAAAGLMPKKMTFMPSTRTRKTIRLQQQQVETVLETAQSVGLSTLEPCEDGCCQKCRMKVKSGTVILDEPHSLSLEDAKKGCILACQAYPVEDLVIR